MREINCFFCETILQQGVSLVQVIINWQAFFVADGGHDPRQLNQGLVKKSSPSPHRFCGHPWVLDQFLAGSRTIHQPAWGHTKCVVAWGTLCNSAESLVMGQSGWHFVVMGQLIALIALQWWSFSASRTLEKNTGATDQEPSTLVQEELKWSQELPSEQQLEPMYSLHEMCIVGLA